MFLRMQMVPLVSLPYKYLQSALDKTPSEIRAGREVGPVVSPGLSPLPQEMGLWILKLGCLARTWSPRAHRGCRLWW